MVLIVVGALFVLAALGAIAVSTRFETYGPIPSEAMVPSIGYGDRLVAVHISGRAARRGDIIVFRGPNPVQPSTQLTRISRVVALGGDRVATAGGRLLVNGVAAREPYLASGTVTERLTPTTVPPNTVYLLGDNRGTARDSRYDGPVSIGEIRARVVATNVPIIWIVVGVAAALGVAFALLLWAEWRRRRFAAKEVVTPYDGLAP